MDKVLLSDRKDLSAKSGLMSPTSLLDISAKKHTLTHRSHINEYPGYDDSFQRNKTCIASLIVNECSRIKAWIKRALQLEHTIT